LNTDPRGRIALDKSVALLMPHRVIATVYDGFHFNLQLQVFNKI